MTGAADRDGLLLRVQHVTMRLEGMASRPPASGLTEADPPTGERWDWGQVWAHLAEFVPYWIGQVRLVVAGGGVEPVPFGRTKADPERIAAIERDRGRPPSALWARMRGQLADLWNMLEHLPPDAWARRGVHPTLGVTEMPKILDEFLVGHLEQHAAQLEGLAARVEQG